MTDYEPAIESMLRPGSRWHGLNADRQQAELLKRALAALDQMNADMTPKSWLQPHVHDYQWDAGWFLFRCACGGASYVGTE